MGAISPVLGISVGPIGIASSSTVISISGTEGSSSSIGPAGISSSGTEISPPGSSG